MMIAAFIASWTTVGLTLVLWFLDQKRHEAQVRDLLDRISTEPRLELRPASRTPAPNPDARTYIADHEADDAAWNEYRGDGEDETE
jgi:hypothetical protein